MTENPQKRSSLAQDSGAVSRDSARHTTSTTQRSSVAAIAVGLDYLLDHYSDWDCSSFSNTWVGASVLIRLNELPQSNLHNLLRAKIEAAQENLHRLRTALGGRSPDQDDADNIARTIIALRAGGRQLPEGLLQSLGRCRQTDGGFALFAEDWSGSAPEVTVTAIQALRTMDRAAEDFLTGRMQSDEGQMTSWLSVCAGILDWEKGLAPLPLLNQACRLLVRIRPQSAFEHALLLRCLVRLRLQQAWLSAAELRGMQLENGSWPGPAPRRHSSGSASQSPDVKNLIPTVTAVSALALGESQPGLYFGSDLPRPRRLYES